MVTVVNGDNTGELFQYTTFVGDSINLDAAGGDDTIEINGFDLSTIKGGLGDDDFTLRNLFQTTIEGGNGGSTEVNDYDVDNLQNVLIDGRGAVTILNDDLGIDGIFNSTVLGGDFNDQYRLLNSNQITVEAGDGDDEFRDLQASSLLLEGQDGNDLFQSNGILGVNPLFNSTLRGGAGEDDFRNIEMSNTLLEGGAESDEFNVAGSGTVRGGDGDDLISNQRFGTADQMGVTSSLFEGGKGVDGFTLKQDNP
jgi:hypothetical protein